MSDSFFLSFVNIIKQLSFYPCRNPELVLLPLICFVGADNKSNIFRAIKLSIAKLMLFAVNVMHDYSLMALSYYTIILLWLFPVFKLWFYTCKSGKSVGPAVAAGSLGSGTTPVLQLETTWLHDSAGAFFPICLAEHENDRAPADKQQQWPTEGRKRWQSVSWRRVGRLECKDPWWSLWFDHLDVWSDTWRRYTDACRWKQQQSAHNWSPCWLKHSLDQTCSAAANDADYVNIPTASTDARKRNQPTHIPGSLSFLIWFLNMNLLELV